MLSNLVAGRKAWTLDGDDDEYVHSPFYIKDFLIVNVCSFWNSDDEGGPSQIELKKDPTTGKLFIDKSGSAAKKAAAAVAAAAVNQGDTEEDEDPLGLSCFV